MKFHIVFVAYSCVLGFVVGLIASLFLVIVNSCIEFIWHTGASLVEVSYYPLIVGVIGGILVGFMQWKFGDYPRTIHDTLHEFQRSGAVQYKGVLWKSTIMAIIVLSFGASLGPEAALAGIVGGLVTWVGDQMKWTLKQKEQLVQLEVGAMLSTVFHSPLIGVSEGIEESVVDKSYSKKWRKVLLYAIVTAFGFLGFKVINTLFPTEGVFAIYTPNIDWTWQGFLLIFPAFIIGALFGKLFLWTETLSESFFAKVSSVFVKGVIGGVSIGLFGLLSSYFLFSGEHELIHFTKEATSLSLLTLLAIAFGKVLLTNICFACGWRGGKIFPALFASVAIGFVLVNVFPYTPGLAISVVVAVSCTVILGQPLVVASLLVFLFPLQFAPFILIVSLIAKTLMKKRSLDTTTV